MPLLQNKGLNDVPRSWEKVVYNVARSRDKSMNRRLIAKTSLAVASRVFLPAGDRMTTLRSPEIKALFEIYDHLETFQTQGCFFAAP